MTFNRQQRQQRWALAFALLCLMQWLSVASHAFPGEGVTVATVPLAKRNAAIAPTASEAAPSSHCHGMAQAPLPETLPHITFSEHHSAEPGQQASVSHSCCDDNCPMLDCHLLSAMVAPSQVQLTTPKFRFQPAKALLFARSSTSPPDRPPIR